MAERADLSELLQLAATAGKIRMINIYFNVDGSFSVTTQGHSNELLRSGNNSDPVAALADALQGKGKPSIVSPPKDIAKPQAKQTDQDDWL